MVVMCLPPSTADVAGVAVDTRHWIGGQRAGSPAAFTDVSPIDEQPIAEVARGGQAEVAAAVGAAKAAFPGWAATPPGERAAVLRAIADGVRARTEELAQVETRDNGSLLRSHRRSVMPQGGAQLPSSSPTGSASSTRRDREISGHAERVSWDAGRGHRGDHPVERPADAGDLAHRSRAGGREHGGRQAARVGAADRQPARGHHPRRRAARRRVQRGTGAGRGGGAPLVAHPDVARVAFTGSVATGRQVAAAAGAQLTPVSLELGGKSPLIVFADADLDLAVGHAVGQFDNAGQVCLAGTRLLVDEAVAGEFTARFIVRAAALRQGDPRDEATDIGPNITRAHLERVDGYVRRAIAAGAHPLLGGSVNPALGGLYYQPTLLGGAAPGSEILTEEVFGPVLTRADLHQRRTRRSRWPTARRYGLAATVFTGDKARARTGVGETGRRDRVGQLLLRPRPARPVRRRRAVRHRP